MQTKYIGRGGDRGGRKPLKWKSEGDRPAILGYLQTPKRLWAILRLVAHALDDGRLTDEEIIALVESK